MGLGLCGMRVSRSLPLRAHFRSRGDHHRCIHYNAVSPHEDWMHPHWCIHPTHNCSLGRTGGRGRRLEIELCQFLKIRNCESRFLLPLSKMGNCELKNNSFSIHFMILLANNSGIDSRKNAKNGQGIAILLESESAQP